MMKKNRIGRKSVLLLAALAVICQTGCGVSGYSNEVASATDNTEAAPAEAAGTGDIYAQEYSYAAEKAEAEEGAVDSGGENTASVASNRKLIKEVYMDVETGDFDSLLSTVEGRVDALGGYMENMNIYNGSNQYGHSLKSATLRIRIPKEKLDQFVTEVSEYSNVVNRSEDTRDVTMQYVDLESHKKALTTEQERLLELLEGAETMEDIIAIEERLSQVRYEIESMETQLRTYDNLVDFSTVSLSISEVEELTPTREETAWEKMGKGFASSVRNLGKGIKNTLIWLVISLPYLVFLAVLVFLIVIILRAFGRRRAKKLQKLEEWNAWQAKQAAGGQKEEAAQKENKE